VEDGGIGHLQFLVARSKQGGKTIYKRM